MYLIFDTETNGFPVADYKDHKMSRVTQLAWKLFNKEGKCFKSFSSLIKPDGWTIPTVAELTAQGNKNPNFFIDNNMSTERCEKEGRAMPLVIIEFVKALEETKYLIAHNIDFDLKMMASEMYRLQIVSKNKPARICTMKSTTDICKIAHAKGGFKWPSLTELHLHLFNKPFEGAHDAMVDVDACADSFFELKRRKLFIISEDIISSKIDESGTMPTENELK